MLRVTEQNEPDVWRLTLEGTLAGRRAVEAERVWSGAPTEKPREVDLRGVTSVDRAGRDLLHRLTLAEHDLRLALPDCPVMTDRGVGE